MIKLWWKRYGVVIFSSVRQFSKHQFYMLRLLNVLFSIKGNRCGRDGEIAKTAEKVDARRDPGYNCVQRSQTHTAEYTAQLLYCNKLPHTNKYVHYSSVDWRERIAELSDHPHNLMDSPPISA